MFHLFVIPNSLSFPHDLSGNLLQIIRFSIRAFENDSHYYNHPHPAKRAGHMCALINHEGSYYFDASLPINSLIHIFNHLVSSLPSACNAKRPLSRA